MKTPIYNSKNVEQLVRSDLLSLEPYPSSPTLKQLSSQLKIPENQIVKLNSAENSCVEQFYPKQITNSYYAYPDPLCVKLRRAIGKYVGFGSEWTACGNGSDELIDLLIALFVGKGEEVLICPPTFPMYEFCSRVRGVKIRKIARKKDLSINVVKLKAAISKKTKMIFIDSPGNPTGTLVGKKDLIALLRKKVIVVVDEAYFEYCGKTAAPLVRRFPNLVVLRSLSKWAGLAGLRIGYLIANPKVIDAFLLIKPPYNVNSVAQELALVALKKRRRMLKQSKKLMLVKKEVVKALDKIKTIKVKAGEGFHILIQLKNYSSQEILQKLKTKGILVKPVNQSMLENSFLASLGSKEKMKKLVRSLKLITKE